MSEYDGPERRRGYEELAAELDKHVLEIEHRFSKWFKAGLIAFAVIGITSAIALGGFALVLQEQNDFTRRQCHEQNARRAAVIGAFRREQNRLIRENPDQAPRIRANTGANLRIINALVPKKDCGEVPNQP